MGNELAEHDQIISVIKLQSLAWREKQFDRLEPLFAETVVFQDSEGHHLAEGKQACIQSYRDFTGIAKVLAYDEEEPDLVLFAGFVMASYGWRIDYEMNGADFHDEGRDWLALERQAEAWRINWRLSLTLPPGSGR
ncbi:MAG: nuclear transport factor 2 family protein [Verrucomicrobia bacterium]|nr:nuclear transport factor 2 family protein [Verrucomicrobiota bacterium]MBV8280186.1 nuclear transport factor 2 family protein [Verrucomicrobiota bacterium]